MFPNSKIVVVVIDFFSGKSSMCKTDREVELFSSYGIQRYSCFEEVINSYKRQLEFNIEFKQYAKTPQKKYLAIVG